jgi:hypothetical protein
LSYSRAVEDDDGQTLVAVPSERRLGCGMHIRSKFDAALLAKDGRAAIPLTHFADLYAIEADCKERGLDADARGEERRRRSWPRTTTSAERVRLTFNFAAVMEQDPTIHPTSSKRAGRRGAYRARNSSTTATVRACIPCPSLAGPASAAPR